MRLTLRWEVICGRARFQPDSPAFAYVVPRPGLEPRSTAWQAAFLANWNTTVWLQVRDSDPSYQLMRLIRPPGLATCEELLGTNPVQRRIPLTPGSRAIVNRLRCYLRRVATRGAIRWHHPPGRDPGRNGSVPVLRRVMNHPRRGLGSGGCGSRTRTELVSL